MTKLTRKISYVALASRVLAVAVMNYEEDGALFDWAVYIDAVPGHNHSEEMQKVADEGDKTSKEMNTNYLSRKESGDLGSVLFPGLAPEKYRY